MGYNIITFIILINPRNAKQLAPSLFISKFEPIILEGDGRVKLLLMEIYPRYPQDCFDHNRTKLEPNRLVYMYVFHTLFLCATPTNRTRSTSQYLTNVLQGDQLKQAQEREHNDAKVGYHPSPSNPVTNDPI